MIEFYSRKIQHKSLFLKKKFTEFFQSGTGASSKGFFTDDSQHFQ